VKPVPKTVQAIIFAKSDILLILKNLYIIMEEKEILKAIEKNTAVINELSDVVKLGCGRFVV